jgi:predicted enzyme related to lactoylglutathione lyase
MSSLSFVNLMARDFERLADFYRDLFGFKEMEAARSAIFRGLLTGASALGFHAAEVRGALGLPGLSPAAAESVRILLTFDVGGSAAVEAATARALTMDAVLLKAPYLTAYGHYQSVLLDPEGNAFRINSSSA